RFREPLSHGPRRHRARGRRVPVGAHETEGARAARAGSARAGRGRTLDATRGRYPVAAVRSKLAERGSGGESVIPTNTRVLRTLVAAAVAAACGAASLAAEAQRPDFTGVWESYRGAPQARASGFGGTRGGLPLTEEGQRRVEEYRALSGPERLNAAAHCANYGVPAVMGMPGSYPLEFIHKPDQLTIIFESNNETRRIYIGDRQLPPERRIPSRAGYSAGHWEGDVLVVKTTDLLDAQDQAANPYSEQATIDERFSLETAANG